ncbi:MAG: uroporphyrinogen decarboxylase family protein [Anaerolineae bacterium]
MTSRERVLAALAHREPDRVPLDMGSSTVTGMHVSSVYLLRQALHLDPPGTPVKVIEPYLMLGEIAIDLADALGLDVAGMPAYRTFFSFRNESWKEWCAFDGTPVLVSEHFNTAVEPDGSLLQYPQGDRNAPASGRMPAGGFYFDTIIRQDPIDDARLNVEDNLEEFGPLSDEAIAFHREQAEVLHRGSDRAVMANFGGTGFGDIAMVPGPNLRHPKGIRDIEEWYISTITRRDYVYKVFERQCEIGIANLERAHAAVGEQVDVVRVTGTDFGAQQGPFVSPATYRNLFKPFHRAVNDWIHRNTTWKTFIHSCGSVSALIPDFIDAGFDILNPVQCSAADMDPRDLKQRFGGAITLWGGGVDTQRTLPFGSPDDVRREVRQRIGIFSPGGGFVFAAVHNIQAGIPVENLLALFEAAKRQ